MCYNGCMYFQEWTERCVKPSHAECPEEIDNEYAAEREREEDDQAYYEHWERHYDKFD